MEKFKLTEPKLYDNGGKIESGKNKRWFIQCTYWDSEGKYFRKRYFEVNGFTTPEERYQFAEKTIPELKRELKRQLKQEENERSQSSLKKWTVSEAFEQMLAIKKGSIRPRSFHTYSSDVRCFVKQLSIGELSLSELHRDHLLRYQEQQLATGKKGKTINGYIGSIKILVSDMVKRGWITEHPLVSIPHLPEEQSYQNRAFSLEQMTRLRPLIAEQPMLSMAVQLMYYCFLRPSEIRGLQVQHFDFANAQIFIPANISKNRKSEHVTIPKNLQSDLENFVGKKGQRYYLFSTDDGQTPIGRNTLSAQHRKILAQVGFEEEHTLYSWKHTGVVMAYRNGLDLKSIQQQCRHHSLDMTNIYLASLGLFVNHALLNDMPKW